MGNFTNRRKVAFDAHSQQRQRHDTFVSNEHAHSVVSQRSGNIAQGNEREVVADFKTVTKLVVPQSGRRPNISLYLISSTFRPEVYGNRSLAEVEFSNWGGHGHAASAAASACTDCRVPSLALVDLHSPLSEWRCH